MYKWIEIQGSGYVTPKCCSLIRESVDSLCRDDADAQYIYICNTLAKAV